MKGNEFLRTNRIEPWNLDGWMVPCRGGSSQKRVEVFWNYFMVEIVWCYKYVYILNTEHSFNTMFCLLNYIKYIWNIINKTNKLSPGIYILWPRFWAIAEFMTIVEISWLANKMNPESLVREPGNINIRYVSPYVQHFISVFSTISTPPSRELI